VTECYSEHDCPDGSSYKSKVDKSGGKRLEVPSIGLVLLALAVVGGILAY
jgi:hypothetical protein